MTDVRIISEPLGGSPLSRLLQSGAAPAHWIAARPAGADGWRRRAEGRRAEAGWSTRLAALAPALQATGRAAERLARVACEGGVVVTTGQQPGLFGGPVYTWSKAVSALAVADEIERRTGIPTAAVYWAATDDADFAEAASTVVGRPGGAQVLRATNAPPAGTPMSLAPLGDLQTALRDLREASGSAADARALVAAQEAYGDPSRSVGGAFVTLLRALLEPLGMPVLDASHPAVLAASEPTLAAARARGAEIERRLAERGEEIEGAGFRPQVEQVAGLSLVFARDGALKRRMGVTEAAEASVEGTYTPNVLLRPIVEAAILPTVAYVAGPGELAYFAQVGAVAEALALPAPLAVPRWSCTLVEPHVDALLQRYGAAVADLAAPDALETRVARAALADDSTRALEQVRAVVAALPEALGGEAGPMGLDAAVQGATRSLQHRLDRLERRLVAGVKRREAGIMRDLGTLRGALHPLGGRQERALNLVPLLARHGLSLLGEMRDAAVPHATALVEGPRQG